MESQGSPTNPLLTGDQLSGCTVAGTWGSQAAPPVDIKATAVVTA
jgi:hypothetical protein